MQQSQIKRKKMQKLLTIVAISIASRRRENKMTVLAAGIALEIEFISKKPKTESKF